MANKVTPQDARKMMDEVLAPQGKTVQNLIDKINSYPDLVFSKKDKQAAIAGISGLEQEIANTINSNAGKSPQEIVALIEANPNISGPISQVNAKKGNLDLKNDIKVADIANSATFNSFVSSQTQAKSNEKPVEKTQTANPTTTPQQENKNPATTEVKTGVTNSPPNPNADINKATATEANNNTNDVTTTKKKKHPLIEMLESIVGPGIATMIAGFFGIGNEQTPANPAVANNPTNSNDVALNTPTQAPTPTQNPPTTPVTPLNTPPNLQAKQPTIGRAG